MKPPLISVIVPCYNQGHWLDELCSSYSSQLNDYTELIIIDDGSNDHTSVVAKNWIQKDYRIKYFFKINGGLSSARNFGIEKAIGSIFHFIDADDLILDRCYLHIFNNFKDADEIIICGYQYFKIAEKPMHRTIPAHIVNPFQSLLKGNFAPPAAHFVSRKVIQKIGLFDTNLNSAEDWDFWFRAALANCSFSVLPEVLIGYRYLPNSMSRNGFKMYEAAKMVLRRYVPLNVENNISAEKHLSDLCLDQLLVRQLIRCLGVEIMKGNVNKAVNYFLDEVKTLNAQISENEFLGFSSYLSFRYFQDPSELRYLLTEVKVYFFEFFEKINFDKTKVSKVIDRIFAPFRYRLLKHQYGPLIGSLLYRFSN